MPPSYGPAEPSWMAAARRKGKLLACEPCRKLKQRCDSVYPVCGNCEEKDAHRLCEYLPSSLTKLSRPAKRTATGKARQPQRRLSPRPPSSTSSIQSNRVQGSVGVGQAPPDVYLGPISSSIIPTEDRGEPSYEPEIVSLAPAVDPGRLQGGLKILRILYDNNICDTLVRQYYERSWVTLIPNAVIRSIVYSVRRMLDGVDANDIDARLEDFANQLFHNSSRPLAIYGSMTVDQYCLSFTGKNFRWEALGNIFALAGLALMPTPDSDRPIGKEIVNSGMKAGLLEQVLEASGICLNFCERPSSANELLGFFQYNDLALRAQYYGDCSHTVWHRLGDLVTTIYAARLHQDIDLANEYPFFIRQWRRSCFAAAYYADKTIATFACRPPLMGYRYCTLFPPWDLMGWNTEGQVHRVSFLRLRYAMSMFREEVLEVALGDFYLPDIADITSRLLAKAKATWEAAPNHLTYDRQVKATTGDPEQVPFIALTVYLEYLHSCFLLQRSVVKRTNTGYDALFQASKQLLLVIIEMGAGKNPLVDLNKHYSWVVLYYGLPSASVLTLDLFRQTRHTALDTIKLRHSEIIRNLRLFVSNLSWAAHPTNKNYGICKDAEKKLSHFLNEILDPQPAQLETFDNDTFCLENFLRWYAFDNWTFDTELFT
ncbi:hypothetical protein PT974_12545 [Cladobotryum mycophilum]|uniref:Zn(2)-C6 fungal-type domain-containing protein n=1 Tax=Cladobotryum mycophilum TaxID=491253 RepID=A0ABR0S889_9HYPO